MHYCASPKGHVTFDMAHAAIKRNRGPKWRFVAILLLFAFALQSYVTATHIHDRAPAAAALAKSLGHNKAPASNDTLNCPFCQAIAHDGAFSQPDVLAFFTATLAGLLSLQLLLLFHAAADAPHNWRSRAPPSH